MKITISQGHEGYEPECWGYVIEVGGSMWFDGGYTTRREAERAANKHARCLRA